MILGRSGWQRRVGSLGALLAVVLAASSPWAASQVLPKIEGEPSRTIAPKSATLPVEAAPEGAVAWRIDLPARSVPLEDADAKGAATQIGGARLVDPREGTLVGATLEWRAMPAGLVATAAIRSPGAAALRVSIAANTARGLQVRFVGMDGAVAGPYAGADLESATRSGGAWWGPVTTGEEQRIELFAADKAAAHAMRLRIDGLSHLASHPARATSSLAKSGTSATCQQDVACLGTPSQALLEASRAVAKIVYTSRGNTYTCSATLVNDRDKASQVPYLLTAAHCIGSRETAATVSSFWFYEKTACGGPSPEPVQLHGGATLLFANTTSDVAMIRLNEPAPAGAWFAGIDPNPVDVGENVVTLHHPRGDVKKVSSGLAVDAGGDAAARYMTVAWLLGTTEPGSSGAGAFAREGDAYVVRGTLRGGSSSCSNSGLANDPSNRTYFNRIDADFDAIGQWLLADAAPLQDYSDLWRDPADPSWGLSIVRQAGNAIAAVWFTHDAEGEPVWAWVGDGRWTSVTTYEAPVYLSLAGPGEATGAGRVKSTRAGDALLVFEAPDRLRFTARLDGVTRTYTLQRAAS